jgi:hypothetical protein
VVAVTMHLRPRPPCAAPRAQLSLILCQGWPAGGPVDA